MLGPDNSSHVENQLPIARISSVGKVGRWQKALRILCQLRFQHAVPDVISHNSAAWLLQSA